MTPEPPKKASEIIEKKASGLFMATMPKEDILGYPIGPSPNFYEQAIMSYLDSQQDAYTTGYNQALRDVQGKISK